MKNTHDVPMDSAAIAREVIKIAGPEIAKLMFKHEKNFAYLPTSVYIFEDETKNEQVTILLSSYTKRFSFENVKDGEWVWVEQRKFLVENGN